MRNTYIVPLALDWDYIHSMKIFPNLYPKSETSYYDSETELFLLAPTLMDVGFLVLRMALVWQDITLALDAWASQLYNGGKVK